MIKTTVQTSGFALGGGENRRLCGGVSLTAESHLAMVRLRMESRAERAEDSLERADLGIGTITESPASGALGKADVFFGRDDDKAVPPIHERLADEVLHGETTMGVVDVKLHCP